MPRHRHKKQPAVIDGLYFYISGAGCRIIAKGTKRNNGRHGAKGTKRAHAAGARLSPPCFYYDRNSDFYGRINFA